MELALQNQTSHELSPKWQVWAVGGLTLLWNLFCAARYVAAQAGLAGTGGATELAYFAAFPVWASTFWALTVWASLAGSALLLVRSKWAVQAFVMAVIGLMGTSLYQYGFAPQMVSIYHMPIALSVWIITLVSMLFASRAEGTGLLR